MRQPLRRIASHRIQGLKQADPSVRECGNACDKASAFLTTNPRPNPVLTPCICAALLGRTIGMSPDRSAALSLGLSKPRHFIALGSTGLELPNLIWIVKGCANLAEISEICQWRGACDVNDAPDHSANRLAVLLLQCAIKPCE